MTIAYFDGFSDRTTANIGTRYDTFGGGGTIGTTSGVNGTKGALIGGTGCTIQKVMGNDATVYFAFRVKKDTTAAQSSLLTFSDSGTTQCYLTVNADGTISAYRGTGPTLLGSSSAGLVQGSWHWVSGKVIIDNAGGAMVLYLDGTLILNLTSQDTQSSANAWLTTVGWALGASYYLDLWVYADSNGGQTYMGEMFCETVLASGAGTHTDFTPSAGANVDNIDDAVSSAPCPDGDTTYNSSSTPGHIDSFAFTNLSYVTGTVHAVTASVYARKDDAGAATTRAITRIAAADYNGTTAALTTSYQYLDTIWVLSPATSLAWGIAEINGAEFGYERVA